MPGKRVDKATGKPVMISTDLTNVRNYTSPFWRTAMANPERRCLVPFTAFTEYGQTRTADGKLPLHWFDVPSRPIVSFAGVWRPLEGGAAVFAFPDVRAEPAGRADPSQGDAAAVGGEGRREVAGLLVRRRNRVGAAVSVAADAGGVIFGSHVAKNRLLFVPSESDVSTRSHSPPARRIGGGLHVALLCSPCSKAGAR